MEQVIEGHELMKPATIASMCEAWRESEKAIREAHRLLQDSESKLQLAFDGSCRYVRIDYEDLRMDSCESLLADLKRKAWEAIIDKINIKKVMSLSKQAEVEEQLKRGDLPDITEGNVLAMLEANYNSIGTYAEQLVKEVYDWIRPRIDHSRGPGYLEKWEYKTNIKAEAAGLGQKVIISWAVEHGYSGRDERPWRINYSKADKFTALDNVFHLLDGKGVVKTHHGPLFDAVAAAPRNGRCETEYFRVWMYSNRNMHLQFKREDLLARFNAVAGGARLKTSS